MCWVLWEAKEISKKWKLCFILYISLLFLLLFCLTTLSKSFFPSICEYAHVCTHTCTFIYFSSVWLLGNSVYMAFLGDDLINHLNHSWYFWTFEMLMARKPSHFWKKGCHKYWSLLEKEPDSNGKYKCYPRKVLNLYIKNIFVPNSYMWLHLFSLCRCPLPGKYDWNVRNVKLIYTLYSSFGSCRFSKLLYLYVTVFVAYFWQVWTKYLLYTICGFVMLLRINTRIRCNKRIMKDFQVLLWGIMHLFVLKMCQSWTFIKNESIFLG